MANLGQKNGIYLARFRHDGAEYKKSLKTRNKAEANAALNIVENTIHRLVTGQIVIPPAVDPGDFIVSGGTLQGPRKQLEKCPSLKSLIEEYLAFQPGKAESTVYTEGVHLRNFQAKLNGKLSLPCDRITRLDLSKFLEARLGEREATTVEKERSTVVQLFAWAVKRDYLKVSPAADLETIKSGSDRPPFRTIEELDPIIERGGLDEQENRDVWECLYLSPEEIGDLLTLVRQRGKEDFAYLLHLIPAYTGMRRGEILRLRWIDLDFGQLNLTARSRKQSRQKTETTRNIDVHPELRDELLNWREQRPHGQYVICDAETLLPLAVDRANRWFWQPLRGTHWCLDSKKNWFKIGFHTYRHSFASNLAAAGVDQRIIDQFMGHQTEEMRKRYQHLFPKKRRDAIQSFSLTKPSKMEES